MRRYGNKRRTNRDKMAAMEARLTLCTNAALAEITAADLVRHGFKPVEATTRLAAERKKRGLP